MTTRAILFIVRPPLDRLERLVEAISRSYLKNVFWPNVFVGASFQILEILKYSSGL
jgi:hypothetical protein